MPWWLDVVLLSAAVLLWSLGSSHEDEVIGLLEKILAVAALFVVLLGGRQIPLELAALAIAFWLPSAARIEHQHRSRSVRGSSSLIVPSSSSAG